MRRPMARPLTEREREQLGMPTEAQQRQDHRELRMMAYLASPMMTDKRTLIATAGDRQYRYNIDDDSFVFIGLRT